MTFPLHCHPFCMRLILCKTYFCFLLRSPDDNCDNVRISCYDECINYILNAMCWAFVGTSDPANPAVHIYGMVANALQMAKASGWSGKHSTNETAVCTGSSNSVKRVRLKFMYRNCSFAKFSLSWFTRFTLR